MIIRISIAVIAAVFVWLCVDVYQAFDELDPPFVGDVP